MANERPRKTHCCVALLILLLALASRFQTASAKQNRLPLQRSTVIARTPHFTGERPKRNLNTNTTHCDLKALDPSLNERITAARNSGSQMLKYTLSFSKEEYHYNPLKVNVTRHFKGDQWRTVFSTHGRTLLSLAFNYDTLSLLMLTFGVEDIDVELVDYPSGCFGRLLESEKFEKIRTLLLNKFQSDGNPSLAPDEEVCNQIIKAKHGQAEFTFECCVIPTNTSDVQCSDQPQHVYIEALYTLIATSKLVFLLFGPFLLQRWIYSNPGELRKGAYMVKLKDGLKTTLPLEAVNNTNVVLSNPKKPKQFQKFRELVETLPPDETVPVNFEKLHIMVDHHSLLSEKRVPVGLFHFLYQNILRCGITRYEPFLTCCKQSIFGSWSPRFLWFPLREDSNCNEQCKRHLSWKKCFKLLGGAILLVLVPLPYYIRVLVFYHFENEEVRERVEAAKNVGLGITYGHNLFQYLTPTHGVLISLYVIYALSLVMLACFRKRNIERFDDVIRGALQDFKTINRGECVRLVLAYIVLPFEKFGFCGLFIGLVFWPIAIPICLLVAVCYCIPTLYLAGRFCVQQRPAWLLQKPWPSRVHRQKRIDSVDILSKGTTSLESALLLKNISPRDEDTKVETADHKMSRNKKFHCDSRFVKSKLAPIFFGILLTVCMCCMLAVFAECFGFLVEISVLTLMGTIVNAGSAARYMMLGFWIVMYCSSCFNNAHKKYLKLNNKLFDFIKDKLNDDVQSVTLYREENQKNTGFKFFTLAELRELSEKDTQVEMDSEADSYTEDDQPNFRSASNERTDTLEFIKGKLYWKINCLIFFVDKKDRPRIPKELFWRVCEIKAPGCPGPVHESLLKATKQLLYMILFLIFVFIVILSFGEFYEISTTNQMLLTLSSGFVPFVVRFVLSPKTEDLALNTYSFKGKIHHIINNFFQYWPVYDLSFKVSKSCSGEDFSVPSATSNTGDSRPEPDENIQKDDDKFPLIDPLYVNVVIGNNEENNDEETQNPFADPDSQSRGSSVEMALDTDTIGKDLSSREAESEM